jgi:isopropylmalate/homocitrate/citramalate synthase
MKTDFKEMVSDGADWIQLVQDSSMAHVNTVMNCQVPQKFEKFLNSHATISFSRTAPWSQII